MRRAFNLHHHKHTGKLIHHRHTSYWALCLIVIVSGLFAVAIERAASADNLLVSATVPAPIPAGVPTIITPVNGATFTTSPIAFSGECPVITPAVIIQFIEGSDVLGSIPCQTDGTFSTSLAVSAGQHTITAQVITITGQTGQSSDPVSITYAPPLPATPTEPTAPHTKHAVSNNDATPFTLPGIDGLSLLAIQLTQSFISYQPGHPISLRATFSGGTPPYTITLNWGDGSTTTQTISDNEMHEFSHTYGQSNPYLLTITLTDARKEVLTRNYAVVDATPVGLHTPTFTAASFVDTASTFIVRYPAVVYGGLLGALLVLWRLEFLFYPNRIGLSMHYFWQHHPKIGGKQ